MAGEGATNAARLSGNGKMIEPRQISGFAVYDEAQNAALSRWIRSVEMTYRRYGFSRLMPRPLELREVLLSRGGIQKQVFGISRLPNDTPTDLALPFDRTVPLANWVAMNQQNIVFPYKRYDVSYSFRGERAQAGRFQGFLQADIDIIGQNVLDASADAECIAVLLEALRLLELGKMRVQIGNVVLAREILRAAGLDEQRHGDILRVLDKIEKQGADQTIADLQGAGLGERLAKEFLTIFGYKGSLTSFVLPSAYNNPKIEQIVGEMRQVFASLTALGVDEESLLFCPGIVRGLDYYTGTVFETFLIGHEGFGSVASGGRFDDLVSTFSDARLPGMGGSIGLTRLFEIACKNGLVPLQQRSESQICIGYRTPELRTLAQRFARMSREAGIDVDFYSGVSSIKKQLAYADRKGIPIMGMVMDAGSFVVREMRLKQQEDLADMDAAVKRLLSLLPTMAKGT